jgi:hypothetical protein
MQQRKEGKVISFTFATLFYDRILHCKSIIRTRFEMLAISLLIVSVVFPAFSDID